LIGDRVGLVLHGGITTTIRVRYTILTACTECRTDAPPVNAYQGALDLDLRTKAHDGFIAYLQAGPGVRRLVEFGGYAVPLQPDVSFAVIGMLHASAGIERLFDKQGLDLQLGAYSGRFNRSAVTDYVATMGFRF
jgi:hypothetical protein